MITRVLLTLLLIAVLFVPAGRTALADEPAVSTTDTTTVCLIGGHCEQVSHLDMLAMEATFTSEAWMRQFTADMSREEAAPHWAAFDRAQMWEHICGSRNWDQRKDAGHDPCASQ